MGAFLLSSGAKGKRFALPHSRIMIHQPSSGTQGRVTDMEIDLRETIRIKELMVKIMAKIQARNSPKIKDDMERDFWMDPDEAKAYGIIDEVIARI